MSDERRKINKHCTGTVPKIKQRNITTYQQDMTNNLASEQHLECTNLNRNSRRNFRNNYFTMDGPLDDINRSVNINGNGRMTESSSSSTSRRNSSTLKCDNVTKCPDKKQIEDKLSQIREYLRITSSLMSTMKNTDDQSNDDGECVNLSKMINDLTDSESKLIDILNSMDLEDNDGVQIVEVNGSDVASEPSASGSRGSRLAINELNLDTTTQDLENLKEQQMNLLQLQQKAENKLRDARLVHEKLMHSNSGNQSKNITKKIEKNVNPEDFDSAIKELEERAKRLNVNEPRRSTNIQDNILAEVDRLHNQIIVLHNANEEREHLIEVLDNRDAELRSQHQELQSKLLELQNKKQHVDSLVAQLQIIDNEEEPDEVGGQVRKIVTMKDQLNKLKDMLEIVKSTEQVVQDSNDSQEANELASNICTTAENFLLNDFHNVKTQPQQSNDSNVLRSKQVNTNSREQQSRGTKPRTGSINEKLALQAELESKKRELEDLMGKHKAGTSNLNHDIGSMDTKSEFSCTNSVNELPWIPFTQGAISNQLSSDDCQDDINSYSDPLDHHNPIFVAPYNYSPANTTKRRPDSRPIPTEYVPEYEQRYSVTPDRNLRNSTGAGSSREYVRERPRSNCDQESKSQVKKQLQLIKSVCESMLDQSTPPSNNFPPNNQQQGNNHPIQLRNNLTPSPLYSEPRRFASPNPAGDPQHWPVQDMASYQSWLTTNTLHTQSFMLNTLNQCCQMLWLQQRELQALRSSLSLLQERMDPPQSNGPTNAQTNGQPAPQQYQNQRAGTSAPKTNHVSTACSMPNLNHFNPSNAHTNNVDMSYLTHNNIQTVRHIDPSVNNINNSQSNSNSVLHGNANEINEPVHHLPTAMWNGQALNNQVAPGNRANNYWDNFRSYSRQNLLKNNDSLQNLPNATEPYLPYSLCSKSNSDLESASTSQENTPSRRTFRHLENLIVPPDVLNVNNQNSSKFGESQMDTSTPEQTEQEHELNVGFQMLLNAYNDVSSTQSTHSEEGLAQNRSRRNEWTNTEPPQPSKNKLFDELRENVYREVASLISANEARPHFLIQLFRDLQLIASDSLRLKTLQSIQSVISHSLVNAQQALNTQVMSESQQNSTENENNENNFSMQSTVWSRASKNNPNKRSATTNTESSDTNLHFAFKDIITYLNEKDDLMIDQQFISHFKQILLESESFHEVLKDEVFQKHFTIMLNEVMEQFLGKRVGDSKMNLMKCLTELLQGELSFIRLIEETNPDSCNHLVANCRLPPMFELQNNNADSPQLHNADLAEADQSRVVGEEDLEEEEDEGAVGGFLEGVQEGLNDFHLIQIAEELEIPSSTFDFPEYPNSNSTNDAAEGLDEVPTRLPTNVRSRSSTPNRDSSRPNSTDKF